MITRAVRVAAALFFAAVFVLTMPFSPADAAFDLIEGDKATYKETGGRRDVTYTKKYKGKDASGNHRFALQAIRGARWKTDELRTPLLEFMRNRRISVEPHGAQRPGSTVGETWTVEYVRITKRGGGKVRITRRCEVVERAEKTVPAGVFDAVRVDCKDVGTGGEKFRTSVWFAVASGWALVETVKQNGKTVTYTLVELDLESRN